eukprot:SRR837773.5264.p1 GENE.SRR837773.5264~~SRR837773.5264.p1  ORF type:complete len:305 (-),score=166.52 SRR837773.5264:11-865(-)
MEELLKVVQGGPDKVIGEVKGMVSSMTGSIEEAIKDPTKLAPSGGGLAACGAWYGSAVAGRLMLFKDDIDALTKSMGTLADDVKTPMTNLAAGVKGAIEELDAAVKGLAKLPKLVAGELQGKDGPEDISKIDTSAMKKALQVSDISKPIAKIMESKAVIEAVIGAMSAGTRTLEEFLSTAPDKVRAAFDVPQPLCFLTSMVMDSAPQAMKDLLALVEKLEKLSLEPIMKAFTGVAESVGKVDAAAIQKPVEAFVKDAKEIIDKLDHVVKGSKAGGMLSGLKKMF